MRIFGGFIIVTLALSLTLITNAQPDPSTYDPKIALDYQEKLFEERDGVQIFDASIAGIDGDRIEIYMVVPPGKGRFAAIIFQHGSEQTRLTYLSEAVLLAKAGAIGLISDVAFPHTDPAKLDQFRTDYIKSFINARRAIDLLVAREDVDKNRIGFVGHSYGAMIGAILAAVDKRIKTFVLLGGLTRLTDHMRNSSWWQSFREAIPKETFEDFLARLRPLDPADYMGRSAPAPILFQCAKYDEVVPQDDCRNLYQIANEPKQIKFYASRHDFQDFSAALDRLKWLQERLRLKPLGPIMQVMLAK